MSENGKGPGIGAVLDGAIEEAIERVQRAVNHMSWVHVVTSWAFAKEAEYRVRVDSDGDMTLTLVEGNLMMGRMYYKAEMEDAKEFMTSVMLHTRMMETANDPDVRKQFGDGMNIVIAGMPHEAPPDPEGSDRPEGQPEAPGAAPA